ncbi:sodium:proton antiporter [Lactobacillaceae bacterium 24-114]
MSVIFSIFLLLAAVVIANTIHLIFPRIPLSIYQIVAGILIALLPTASTDFTMHPELFMMAVIAPLMFNDGQNQSFRVLTRNIRNIISLSVSFALVAVLIIGVILHTISPSPFTLPLAFMLAAIITPTDAVAVKSLSTNVKMPGNVNTLLEVESLFNDASGIVLLDLALAAFTSGTFSLTHGIWYFSYVFFGGIIFGAIIGYLLIALRMRLMRQYVDIGSIVIPINIMTPIVIYWLAEEFHFSGILAVVAAGIIHSIWYDRLRLTSTKVQIATMTIWNIISDALNGIVFVLLGLLIPQVLGRTSLANLTKLIGLAIILFLVMLILRYLWGRFNLVHLHSTLDNRNRDSWLLALGGVHGTITLALAFSLPIMVNGKDFAMRNNLIMISALVILISIAVGAIAFPLILPKKANEYTESEFHSALVNTVQYAINELKGDFPDRFERAIIIDQLSSQMTQLLKINQDTFEKIVQTTHQLELDIINDLTENEEISQKQANWYRKIIARSIFNSGHHSLLSIWKAIIHRIRWHFVRKPLYRAKWKKKKHKHPEEARAIEENMAIKIAEMKKNYLPPKKVFAMLNRTVNHYLDAIQNQKNINEVTMIRRSYLYRSQYFTRNVQPDTELMNSLYVEAFQLEHSYVQQRQADGTFSPALANALNEQISVDELVMAQSME